MVDGGWWSATPQWQRRDLIADRLLNQPEDGTCWLFGAWARWYRRLPGDGQWQPCPAPLNPATRAAARPLPKGGPVPPIPPQIVPSGPDFAHRPPTAAFVGADLPPELTSGVGAAVETAAALPVADYPHRSDLFSANVPSAVAVAWDVMLWCAAAPVFDARLDPQLLGLWSPYRSVPLPTTGEARWLTPPTLEAVLAPYAERLRAGRVDCAGMVLRTMWTVAGALRADDRFRARADALLAVMDASLRNPVADYPALPHGDGALVRHWLTRRPPELEALLRAETSPGDRFREAYHDLAVAAAPLAGDPAEPKFVEPRHIAAALLAADLATVRRGLARPVIAWLDSEIRELVSAVLDRPEHSLRRLSPTGDRLPDPLRERVHAAEPAARDALLAAVYATDLAWCRLAGGIPARPRGFPAPLAILDAIRERAEPVAGLPTLAPDNPEKLVAREAPARTAQPPPAPPSADEPPRDEGGAELVPEEDRAESTAPWAEEEEHESSVAEAQTLPSPGPPPGEEAPAGGKEAPKPPMTVEWVPGKAPGKAEDPADADAEAVGGTCADVSMPSRRTGPTGTIPEPPRLGTREMSEEMVDEVLKAAERRQPGDLEGFLSRLDDMVGLAEVKHTVRGLVAEARLAAERAAQGLPSGNPSRHLIFLGDPGTGKATVAGLIGGVYAALGLLDSGHLVVCNADGLGGGQEAVAAQAERAEGGLLLINDAHLLDDAPDGFAELLRLMRDRRDKFMLVCAGPPDEMNAFLVANPGFRAEFGAIIEFRQPTESELVGLFSRFAERDLYVLDEELRDELLHRFRHMRGSAGFAYATTTRRLFERMVQRQAARLAGGRRDAAQAARLTVRDLPDG